MFDPHATRPQGKSSCWCEEKSKANIANHLSAQSRIRTASPYKSSRHPKRWLHLQPAMCGVTFVCIFLEWHSKINKQNNHDWRDIDNLSELEYFKRTHWKKWNWSDICLQLKTRQLTGCLVGGGSKLISRSQFRFVKPLHFKSCKKNNNRKTPVGCWQTEAIASVF